METEEESLVAELRELHRKKQGEIKKRLIEFSAVGRNREKRLFAELCFCLCTPQTKAHAAWYAIGPLMDCGRLYSAGTGELEKALREAGVRFHRTKARNIAEARSLHMRGLAAKTSPCKDAVGLRNLFAEEVRGLGMKEASHFLRNIGLGCDLAILDRHILRNLVRLKVIPEIPKTLTKKKYLEVEDKMRMFSKRVGIPLDELDLLFWMRETGEVFK
jgi:N-glycosylase/DNA lyase